MNNDKNIHAQKLGKLGGDKYAENRFKGKTDAEKSEIMRKVRMSNEEIKQKTGMSVEDIQKRGKAIGQAMVDALNNSPRDRQY